MIAGFLWCPNCRRPHALADRVCPATGSAFGPIGRPRSSPPSSRPRPHARTPVSTNYRLVRRIGAGGMGEVYEAVNRFGRKVAIKLVGAAGREAAERLRYEATVIASLCHPNICAILDVGAMPDGNPYVVLEHLAGETLGAYLRREGWLDPPEALRLFQQLLGALSAAHAAGILHRDVKPGNVFLVAEPRGHCVKLLDFGLAFDLAGRRARVATRPGVVCGTMEYMSPEQLRGTRLDVRSDLFSFGLVLFETLTGRHPFAGRSAIDTATKIMRETAPSVRAVRASLPPSLERVVARALANDPGERFASAGELYEALEASVRDWIDSSSTATRPAAMYRVSPSSAATPR